MGTSSVATAGVEIGGTAGVHLFAGDNALGTKENDPIEYANSALFALRVGAYFGSMFGVELEGGVIPTEAGDENVTFDVFIATARLHAVAQFRADDPSNKVIPFVMLGGGAMTVADIGTTDESLLAKETKPFGSIGAGVKYRAGGAWGVRADARLLLPPSNEDKPVTIEGEFLLSLYREFGRKEAPKPEPAPTADPDADKDGIIENDACPNEPEDKDGFEDEDGCPDPDNDQDGIPDEADKCPNEPEDMDGFQDDDGCPDPDNDQDGVPDAADKCPDQPETMNGFEDDDGCPDEVPEKLAKFTGTIQGINFKTNSADLLPGSTKILDKAIAVLNEFPEVRLEIQGHTDDQVPKKGGKFADNDALSQARAETVKDYFIKKGIAEDRIVAKGYGSSQPITDPTDLKGAKLRAARAQNRRVEFKLISGGEEAEAPVTEPAAEEPATEAPAAEEPATE